MIFAPIHTIKDLIFLLEIYDKKTPIKVNGKPAILVHNSTNNGKIWFDFQENFKEIVKTIKSRLN